MIGAGSANENKQEKGAAHFLEHMHFKGTKKRNATQLELEFESIGATYNAFTTREYTVFSIQVIKRNVNRAIALFGDILNNSVIDFGLFEEERGTIHQELLECRNQYFNTVLENAH